MKKARIKRKIANAGFALTDAILTLVILVSLGFIGYRLMNGKKSTAPANQPVAQAPAGGNGPATSTYKSASAGEWAKLMAMPAFQSGAGPKTKGCPAGERPDWGLPVLFADVAKMVKDGEPLTLFGFAQDPCVSVGQTVNIVHFDKAVGAVAAEYLGTAKIETIVTLRAEQIPPAFFQFIELDPVKFQNYLTTMRLAKPLDHETIVRMSPVAKKPATDGELPRVLPRGRAVSRAELPQLMIQHPNLKIFDVRSASEFAKGSIAGAVNVPYSNSITAPPVFSYSKKVSELLPADFNNAPFIKERGGAVALVGAGVGDPRPLWIALTQADVVGYDTYWIYDGIK